jgi:asparagine synthase (glutamine-hydrolysing)
MCGITGLFDLTGGRRYDPALVRRMTDAVVHRGPDGDGYHFEAGVAFGHRRLAIIDIAGGAQPMQTRDGGLTIVFNGEIYNFLELKPELERLGARFESRSDTEVLLHGWRHWGPDLFSKLNGMFAFALWDTSVQTLVLARDRFGKKPLHYAVDGGTLAFGSEIKSLLCTPSLDRALDLEAIEDFFTYGYVPDPKTIYRAVRKLPPAHYLLARRGRPLELHRYWSPLDGLDRTMAASDDALIARLEEAVRARLISDVPLGALLSGGVDSSAVVALMARESARPVRTFSIAFGERDFDETTYAAAVAKRYATDHDVRTVDADDFGLVSRLPQVYDEPFGDISAIPTLVVCAQARRSVTVALTGDGGDEVLAGYRRYAFHQAEQRIRAHVPARLRRPLFGSLARIYPRAAWLPRSLRAKTTFQELSLEPADAYARIVSALPIEVRATLLSGDFRDALAGYDAADVVRAPFNVDAPLDPLQRAQYADMMTYLPGDILTKVDRASMANSLELRAPMLDPAFASWSLALPSGLKLSPSRGGKAILKRAMEPYLPTELLYRPKRGFTVPLARWLRGPLSGPLHAICDSVVLRDCGVVNMKALQRLATDHLGGLADNSKALWSVWAFEAFLRHEAVAR